jgi:phosphoglycerol transferase MdoB-like AlkP superfamily enzyme
MAIVIILAASLIVKYMNIERSPIDLKSRLLSPYAIPTIILSVIFYGLLNSNFNGLKFSNHFFQKFVFIAYFFLNSKLITNLMIHNFKVSYQSTTTTWLMHVFLETFAVILIIIMTYLFIKLIRKLKPSMPLLDNWSINSLDDLLHIPSFFNYVFQKFWKIIVGIIVSVSLSLIFFITTYIAAGNFGLMAAKFIIQNSFGPLIFNALILLGSTYLLYGLTNKYIFSICTSTIIYLLIIATSFLKIKLRNEPIMPADLSMLTSLDKLLKMVNPIVLILSVIMIILFAFSSFLLSKTINAKYKIKNNRIKNRIILIICSGFFLFFSLGLNGTSISKVFMNAFSIQNIPWNSTKDAELNGPIVHYFSQFTSKIMEKPKGYSKKQVKKIMRRYDERSRSINKTRTNSLKNQTMIFILSESFSDPNRVPGISVKPNPMQNISNIMSKSLSGQMLSTGYGGGTANIEWQSLTGMSYSNLSPTVTIPYYQIVPRQKDTPAITNLFDNKIAIHPFPANFYNRINVFKQMGFEKFYHLEGKNKLSYTKHLSGSVYISDDSAYKELLFQLNKKDKGSKFIQLTTMQNHTPYTFKYDKLNKHFSLSGQMSNSEKAQLATYAQGMSYTDDFTEKLIKKIDDQKKNITIVWYGDHLPAIYPQKTTHKYGLKLHESDYFVYNNKSKKIHAHKLASPYEFSSLALKASNSKVTGFYALLTDITSKIPSMNINTDGNVNSGKYNIFVNNKNKVLNEQSLTNKQKKLLNDYRVIQYDLVAGNQYSAKWAKQK